MTDDLTEAEAALRLTRDGYNDLPATDRRSTLRIIGEVLSEPMFALLLAAAVLYLLLGDRLEALALLGFATISVSIAVIQQGRSEHVLAALRELSSPRALVMRGGQQQRIPGRNVVVGDTLIATEGDRVAADAILFAGDTLLMDESLLTGESVAVQKSVSDAAAIYSGTLVLRGTAYARVTATGARSELGKIGHALSNIQPEPPRLQTETRRLVLVFGLAGALISILAILLYGWLIGNWLQAILGGIALGMSMLPEEFPLVLTVFMVMGAWRLSLSQVLTRRAAAIETLGAATVLCTDKTGTLTRNQMQLIQLHGNSESWHSSDTATSLPQSLHMLLQTAALATDTPALDPMDRAIQELLALSPSLPPTSVTTQRSRSYPLTPELPIVAHAWSNLDDGNKLTMAAKGAPEVVAQLCQMNDAELRAMLEQVTTMARAGMRVLAVAQTQVAITALPADIRAIRLNFAGLLGFADPLRSSVPEAVRECRNAGVRVLMITGDYPETACAIARQAGMDATEALHGAQLELLDDAALALAVKRISVYARITPGQKLRIVNALKSAGETVAMTGDGVNDAPALKAAHIGIAMGKRGTDVAREAASLVLLDDDFSSIVRALRHGRRIFDNLRKAMRYILAIHVPIAGVALLPILLGAPLVLTPVLIALLELVVDPTCSVVLEAEPEEPNIMQRPPRPATERLLSGSMMAWSIAQGSIALALVAALYLGTRWMGLDANALRAQTFLAIVAVIVALLVSNCSSQSVWKRTYSQISRSLWVSMGSITVIVTLLLIVPIARQFLGFGLPSPWQAGSALACGALLLLVLELAKAFTVKPRA